MTRLFLIAFFLLVPISGAASCRLALAMALDVSGSVDETEYRLQMSGLAAALSDPDVEAAFLAIPDAPVALAVYEWSSARYQRVVQDWILIEDQAVLKAVRQNLATWSREKAPEATGLGAALLFGKAMLDRGPACWNQTLDVSGDGKNNDWPEPRQVRADGSLPGLRINALVVGRDPGTDGPAALVDAEELSAYFRANVIQGADAFVEVALGFRDYAAAMRRKLLRELKAQPIGALPGGAEEQIIRTGLGARAADQ